MITANLLNTCSTYYLHNLVEDSNFRNPNSNWLITLVMQGGSKMAPFLYTLQFHQILTDFRKNFHCQNQETICNKTVTIDSITPEVCRYTTLSVLRITIKNKTTSATTHFKKLTTETTCVLSQLLSKKVASHFLHQLFNVSVLLLDDASKTATPLTNGAINQTLRQFAPLSDDRLLQLVDCRESSKLIGHLLKNIPNRIIDRI